MKRPAFDVLGQQKDPGKAGYKAGYGVGGGGGGGRGGVWGLGFRGLGV